MNQIVNTIVLLLIYDYIGVWYKRRRFPFGAGGFASAVRFISFARQIALQLCVLRAHMHKCKADTGRLGSSQVFDSRFYYLFQLIPSF